MAGQKKTEKAIKVKRKRWQQIIAPKIFGNVVLGETLIAEPKLALNKTITQNLMNLTHDMKKQNINMKFIVNKVEGNNAHTKIIGYDMVPTSVRRLTRRGSEKIKLSFVCKTSDNIIVRVKPLIFTRGMVKNSVTTKLRKTITEYLPRAISKMTFDNLLNDLINYKLQFSLKDRLKKIYPLRKCEIESMGIEKEKKPVEEKKVENVREDKEAMEEKKVEEPKKEESNPTVRKEKEEKTQKNKEPELKEEATVQLNKEVKEEKKEVKEENPKEEPKEVKKEK